MSAAVVHLVVPGPIRQRTGGYLYDARMVDELRGRGRHVVVHELNGSFPDADEQGRASLEHALGSLEDEAVVVIDGLAGGGLPDVLAGHAHRLRMIALVHHPLTDETGLDEAGVERFFELEHAALRSCRGVLVTSPFTADRLSAFGVRRGRVKVAVPGTERADPAPAPEVGRPARLLCVASLTRRKGHDVLLEALSSVSDLEWSCVLAGSHAYDAEHAHTLRDRVSYLGMDDRVSFVGELDTGALDALYRQSTLFVLASYYEGYGMALTEALARGLPVVSTTGGAIPFTVPADAGLLVPPGDAQAFGAALREVMTKPGRLADLRVGALRAASSLPDWPTASHAFEEALEALAGMDLPGDAGAPS